MDYDALNAWFCREVLPLEPRLLSFIRRHWRRDDDARDLLHDIYERVLVGSSAERPSFTRGYVFAVARNLIISRARRAQIISFDLVADLETLKTELDFGAAERQLSAREDLRRVEAGLGRLPPRCREVIRLRKVEGLSIQEVATRLQVSVKAVERQTTLGMRALVDFMLGGTGKIERRQAGGRIQKKSAVNDP